MIAAATLLLAGLVILSWHPSPARDGRLPRATATVLLAGAAAIWLGSLGIVVAVVSGELGGIIAACGALWDRLVRGGLVWWHLLPAGGWLLAFPTRGLWALTVEAGRCRRLQGTLAAAGTPLDRRAHARAHLVPGLGTPALTLGMLHPQVFIDETFWETAQGGDQAVVLAHEHAHRRGRHGLFEALGVLLLSPVGPLPAARHAQALLRLQLEALADDAAARRHNTDAVGHALGRIALAATPRSGLGAAGANVWRVRRLLAPHRTTPAVLLVVPALTGLLAGLAVVAVDVGGALGHLVMAANLCLL